MLALALALGLTGCQALSRHEAKKIPQLGIIDPHQPRELEMVSLPPRVIEPPDVLEIQLKPSDLDLKATDYTVQPEGTIDLGFYGDLYVAGLTLDQIEAKLAQHLARMYALKRPGIRPPTEVSVRLNSDESKFYYVLGSVRNQKRFPINGGTRVLDAILDAGLLSNSLPEKAYLVRPHPNGAADQVLKIDWVAITKQGNTLTNYQVMPGDRIFVPGTTRRDLRSLLLGD
jgi:polysaccharide export outer membrane protein